MMTSPTNRSEYTFINPMSKDMRTTRAIQKGLIDPSKPFAQPVRNKDLGIPSFPGSPIIYKGGGFKEFFKDIGKPIVPEAKPYMPTLSPEDVKKRFSKERAEEFEKYFQKFKGKI